MLAGGTYFAESPPADNWPDQFATDRIIRENSEPLVVPPATRLLHPIIPAVEESLLTVPGNYGKATADQVIGEIVHKLSDLLPRPLRLKRYIKQLEVLAKLRNLPQLPIKISEKVALVYDLKTDTRFKQGTDLVIVNLLKKELLAQAQIAEAADVPLAHVQAIARKLANS